MISRPARYRFAIGALALSLPMAAPAWAQSQFEQTLKQFSGETAKGYFGPLAELLIADLNSGYYHSAAIAKAKLGVSLDIVVFGSKVQEKHKTYVASTPPGFDPSTFETATVFGGTGSTVTSQSGTEYRGSDGFIDADYLPFAVPQIRVGGIAGTEVIVRYMSSGSLIDDGDIPKPTLFGFGLRHSISQYFPTLPVDIAIGGLYNSLKAESDEQPDLVDITSMSLGAQVSKSFSLLGLYGGVSSESGTMTLKYTSTDPNSTTPIIETEIKAKRQFRATAGAAVFLGPLHLFGDASFGSITTFSGGLRIGF